MKPNPVKRHVILGIFHAITILLSLAMVLFSALSGAQPGFNGLLRNLPNCLPWLIMLAVSILAVSREVWGGLLMIALSVGLVLFFKIIPNESWNVFFLLIFPFLLTGIVILAHGLVRIIRS